MRDVVSALTAGLLMVLACAAPAGAATPEGEPLRRETAPRTPQQALADIASLKDRLARVNLHMPDGSGLARRIAERRVERVWQDIAESTHQLARDLTELEEEGGDRSVYRDAVVSLLGQIDSAIREAAARVNAELDGLSPDESQLKPVDLARLYHERNERFTRLISLYRGQARNVVWMAEFEMPAATVAATRDWLASGATATAEVVSLSLEIATDDAARLNTQLRRLPDQTDLEALRVVVNGRIQALAANLHDVVDVLDDQGVDVAAYRQQIVLATHDISDGLLDTQLLGRLTANALGYVETWLTSTAPRLLVKTVVLASILLASWGLARLIGRLVERAMASRRISASQLLRDLVARSSRRVVLLLGILVALAQIGISIGPLLAGLGVVGFVVGFAMQDSLSNFASGVLILIYRPFDVGDTVQAGDVFGLVRDMSLVNTTILTFDNQTLVVPNTKIWGGVIRNVTAQRTRRVDLTFGISYSDDIAQAESILMDIVTGHPRVLKEPAPVVKLHELADSSVNFVVRPWVRRDDYWDVYWDITREVKVRFDAEGVSIPFPHRQLVISGPGALQSETAASARKHSATAPAPYQQTDESQHEPGYQESTGEAADGVPDSAPSR